MRNTKLGIAEVIERLNDEIQCASDKLDETIILATSPYSDGGIVISEKEAKDIKLVVKMMTRRIEDILRELSKLLN